MLEKVIYHEMDGGREPPIPCRDNSRIVPGGSSRNQPRNLECATSSDFTNLISRLGMAERVGFEPTEQGLPIHTLSKRAP